MYTIGKCILFALAMLGYAMLWRRKRLPVSFFPVTAVSGVTLAVYVIGLCGSLRIGVAAVLAVGLLLLVLCFSLRELKTVLTDGSMLFCAAACVVMYAATRGQMLFHFDDGTHWYRISKALYYDGNFPSTPDILFYDYVPGAAIWNNIVLRMIGFSIPNCMFAQNLINVAAVSTLFSLSHRTKDWGKKLIITLTIAAAGIVQCTYAYGVYTLLVDLPLGMMVMAAAVMVLEWGDDAHSILPVGLVVAYIALMKNSGLFFGVLICLMAVLIHRVPLRRIVGWIGAGVLTWGAYMIRSRMVYGGTVSPQMISLSRYLELWSTKDPGLIRSVAGGILNEVAGGTWQRSQAVYTCFAALILLCVCMHQEGERDRASEVRRMLTVLLAFVVIYGIMLFFTYLFSMDNVEARVLNSLDRYFGTAVIILIGLTIYTGIRQALGIKHGSAYVLMAFLMIALLVKGQWPRAYVLDRKDNTRYEQWKSDLWWAFERIVPENMYYTEDSYLILWNDADFMDNNNTLRVSSVGQAWLRSVEVEAVSDDQLKSMSQEQLSSFAEYDHIIFLSDMNAQRALLEPYLAVEDYGVGMQDNLNRGQ